MTLSAVTAGDQATAAQYNAIKNHLEGDASSTLAWFLRCTASQNFVVKLSDAGGVQKFSIQDSTGAEVAAVDSNGGLTISGAFTPGTLILPSGTAPTPTAAGEVWWDSDDDQFIVGTGASQVAIGAGTTDHGALSGLADDDHTMYLKEKASGGTAAETPTHDHSVAAQAGTIAHSVTTGKTANDHHNEAHTVPSHTGTPGGELGGTWTSPTVDTTHSGSSHAGVVSSHESTYAHATAIPTTVSKTAGETVNSSTTFQSDNHLTFSVAANTIYKVTGFLTYTTGSTPIIKFQWSVPASAAYHFEATYRTSYANTWHPQWTSLLIAGPLTTNVAAAMRFSGLITVAGTSGTAVLQWAQYVSDAGDTTVNDGSWITYEAVS